MSKLDWLSGTLKEGDVVYISSQNIDEKDIRIAVKIEFIPGREPSEIEPSVAQVQASFQD
jgi:hypothetical protein